MLQRYREKLGARPVRLAHGSPVHLLSPRIRYTHSRFSDALGGSKRSGWKIRDGSACTFDAESLRLDVLASGMESDSERPVQSLVLSATAVRPTEVGLCAIRLAFPCESPPEFVDRSLRLKSLRGSASLNDYTPLVLRWRGDAAYELRNERGFTACRLWWRQGWLHVTVLLDAAALHPRWYFNGPHRSEAAPLWEPGQSVTVRLLLSERRERGESPTLALGRLPAGAEAAFALTDHCDFDTTDRLRTFLHGNGAGEGWLGRGLRLTKSVFALDRGPEESPTVSINDGAYRTLIHALAQDGSEIVPHSLNEWGGLDPATFHAALTTLAAEWSPRVWIDHGYLPYNYTMGGGRDPNFRLLDKLAERGFVALAAGHDIPIDACASLNMLAPPSAEVGSVSKQTWLHVRQRHTGTALRYLRAAIRRRLAGPSGYVLDGLLLSAAGLAKHVGRTGRLSRANWVESWGLTRQRIQGLAQSGPRALQAPHTRKELLDVAAIAYPERGVPLSQADTNELLLFTTQETIHTKDIYTPDALNRLLDERGLHVGHCYLLNNLPYIAGIFDSSTAAPRLSTEWLRFIDLLSHVAQQNRVWNPVVSDLVEYMRLLQHVALVPDLDAGTARLANLAPRALKDVTLLLPRSVSPAHVKWGEEAPKGWRYWDDWLAIWGDLPASSAIPIRWSSATAQPAVSTGPQVGIPQHTSGAE